MAKEKKENILVRTFNKVKRISNVIDVIVQLGYIAYLILSIYLIKGNMIANYIFLGVSVAYLIYHCFTYKKWMEGDKVHRKQIKKFIKFLKKLVNIAVIVFAIIEVTDAGGEVDFFQVVSAVLMVIGFFLSLLLEWIVLSLKRKINRLKESVKEKMGSIKESVGTGFTHVKEGVTTGGKKVKETAVNVFNKAKTGVSSLYKKHKDKKNNVIEVETSEEVIEVE